MQPEADGDRPSRHVVSAHHVPTVGRARGHRLRLKTTAARWFRVRPASRPGGAPQPLSPPPPPPPARSAGPTAGTAPPLLGGVRELNTYNYFRRNVAGVQREWWYHRSGCRAWFVADRDTTTNEVNAWACPGVVAEMSDRLPPSTRRAHRPPPARSSSASTARRSRRSRGTRSAPRCTPPADGCSRAASSTTGPAGCSAAPASARTAWSRWTAGPASAPAPSPVARPDARQAHERQPLAALRRDAGDRHLRQPAHPAGLLLQDLHPPAPPVAAVREGAPRRRRPRKARQEAGRPAVAHRVPPPPCGRARDRRRPRRDGRGAAAAEMGADVVLVDDGPELGGCQPARGPAPRRTSGRACWRGSRCWRRPRPSASSTGSCPCGRAARCTRSAPSATSPPPARSSSR